MEERREFMKENRYPLFEGNRVLKKEMLWSLRDYLFASACLEYQEYEPGILHGCKIQVQQEELVIGPGIVKCGEFICLSGEEMRISYEPSNSLQVLKLWVETETKKGDSVIYQMGLSLGASTEKKKNEFELCRFHLRHGAKLRDDYKSFADMATEYDMVNLIYADWSGRGGRTLAPEVTRHFARELLSETGILSEDRAFAYQCLSEKGGVPAEILRDYVRFRRNLEVGEKLDVLNIYESMCIIIKEAAIGGGQKKTGKKEKHKIWIE